MESYCLSLTFIDLKSTEFYITFQVTMEDWPENKVNDGEWHEIYLDYYDNVSYDKTIST